MELKIIIHILFYVVFYQEGVLSLHHPIGPSFVSTSLIKQKLYYNNLGTRLDCLATGNPQPILTWFRTNGTDDRPSTFVQTSEFIHVYENGSLFIRPFREYSKSIHAGTFVCRAENAAGSIQTTPIQLKPQIYDSYEIEVKNTFGFEESSVILACEISPPSASSYVHVIGWLEKINNQIIQLDLQPRTKYNLLANKNLIIHNITKLDDNRTYSCIINNKIDNDTRQSRFKSLRVRDRSPFGPELSIPNNTEYRAQAGDLIELPCGISSIPANSRISWWKNGIEINNLSEQLYNNSLILQLSSLSSNDSGHYACRIDDELGGHMTSLMSLKIDVPIQCQMSIEKTIFNAGSKAELSCNINIIKSTSKKWEWYHNSKRLLIDHDRYYIENLTREHMGMYQCCYVTNNPSDSNACCAQTQIYIINSPPFILSERRTDSKNIIIVPSKKSSHGSIDFNLTFYANPKPTVDLYKDGQVLETNHRIEYLPSGDIHTHHNININSIIDTGLYEYRVTNSFGSISYSKHININEQMPFIPIIANMTVVNDQQFTLTCYASGQPNLTLIWIDERTKEILNTSSTSPIHLVTKTTQTNIYTCQAINLHGKYFQQVYVQIQIPARILSVTSNKTARINDKLDVYCIAEGDNQIDIELKNPLYKKSYQVEDIDGNKKKISLNIANIQMSDSGLYECSVKNNYSQDHSTFEILVQNIPNKIENVFIEDSNRISWMKPFDGNSKILKYIIRIRYKQATHWSNETIITIDNSDITSYSFENFSSKCSMTILIEAVNIIGSSLPSNPLLFQTNTQQLLIAPNNLSAVNISSTSVVLTWQYPSFQFCHDEFIEYIIEIIDKNNQTIIQTYKHNSKMLIINHLKSYTSYTFVVYAINEYGPSPRSKPLTIQTLEYVPHVTIQDLKAVLLNVSSVRITWLFENQNLSYLNGRFRTFAVTLYENFDMSTLTTIETINSDLIVDNLNQSSHYYISVSICNYFDCGPSSTVIQIETSSFNLNMPIKIRHPINKPIILDCPLPELWLNDLNSTYEYVLHNNSLYIPNPKLLETKKQYNCGSKQYNIQLYDKPSSLRASIYYQTSNEIGIKFHYSKDIIESITIVYKSQQNSVVHEYDLSPPLVNIHLSNLSCGNPYEIKVYSNNKAGSNLNQYLLTKTDGSIPSIVNTRDLIKTISNTYVILNMSNWIINQCSILSYDIEIYPIKNASDINFHQYYSFKNSFENIQIDNLLPNHDYQLHIKVNSQAGEIVKILSFQTTNDSNQINTKSNYQFIILLIITICFIFLLLSFIIILILIKFCQINFKKSDIFIKQTKKLKPVLCSSYPHDYHSTWLKSNNEFTMESYKNNQIENPTRPYSYASEDSQGNINPYAVTGCVLNANDRIDHSTLWRETKHTNCLLDTLDHQTSKTPSERYFRPIILESSINDNQECLRRNPLVQVPPTVIYPNPCHPSQPCPSVLSTVSSSQGELFSAFTYLPPSKQTILNGKRLANNNNNNNNILADQSSSSADSGVHSSYTQSPIIKHSLRKCHVHGFLFDRPSSVNLNDDQNNHLYATYDRHSAFLKKPITTYDANVDSIKTYKHHQEQYSLV